MIKLQQMCAYPGRWPDNLLFDSCEIQTDDVQDLILAQVIRRVRIGELSTFVGNSVFYRLVDEGAYDGGAYHVGQ